VPEATIRRRLELALFSLLTLPGIPQLYYGDELGLYGGLDPDNRRDMPAWAWDATTRGGSHPGLAAPGADATFALVRALIGLRRSEPALYGGSYAELWRPNGSARDVFAFFRAAGASEVVVGLDGESSDAGPVLMNLRDNPDVDPALKPGLADGRVFDAVLATGAPATVTLTDGGKFRLTLASGGHAVYRARTAGVAVTVEVRAATTPGESLHVIGSIAELGGWRTAESLRMSPRDCQGQTCTWSVTVRYLPSGTSARFKLLRKGGGVIHWESGGDRSLVVGESATQQVDLTDVKFP
jgi:hypothetical protein